MMRVNALLLCLAATLNAGYAIADASNESTPKKNTESTRYVHLNAKGKAIGHNPVQAACVKDKSTGLVWELKTLDEGLHARDKGYRWGGIGTEKQGIGFYNDWDSLIQGTNKEKLCGFKDWRVPGIDELKSLVTLNSQGLKIDTQYFFDTLDSPYWSVTAYTNYPEHAQTVHFGNGTSYYYNGFRGNPLPVRLVRGKFSHSK